MHNTDKDIAFHEACILEGLTDNYIYIYQMVIMCNTETEAS